MIVIHDNIGPGVKFLCLYMKILDRCHIVMVLHDTAGPSNIILLFYLQILDNVPH